MGRISDSYNFFKLFYRIYNTDFNTINDDELDELKQLILDNGSISIKFMQWYISKLINECEDNENYKTVITKFEDIFDNCPYHTDEETIFQESALYKVKSKSLFEQRQIQNVIKKSHANIVTVNTEFFVIEKTGFREETEKLYKDLAPYGLLQFVRSGRISVTKSPMEISHILKEFSK